MQLVNFFKARYRTGNITLNVPYSAYPRFSWIGGFDFLSNFSIKELGNEGMESDDFNKSIKGRKKDAKDFQLQITLTGWPCVNARRLSLAVCQSRFRAAEVIQAI